MVLAGVDKREVRGGWRGLPKAHGARDVVPTTTTNKFVGGSTARRHPFGARKTSKRFDTGHHKGKYTGRKGDSVQPPSSRLWRRDKFSLNVRLTYSIVPTILYIEQRNFMANVGYECPPTAHRS